jgi:glycosyltransferase involved in cell wall biosynthesis
MWTKNGERTLPAVLDRINHVIPENCVNSKLVVDDASTDRTCQVAQFFGWSVIPNEGKDIADGANTALKYVETEFFASFEQDLLLAEDWWTKIPRMLGGNVSVASGFHMSSVSVWRAIEEYSFFGNPFAKSYRGSPSGAYPGQSLDNTVYQTEIIRKIGGFPGGAPNSTGVDLFLRKKLSDDGYLWKVDPTVRSTHLRHGVLDEINHLRSYNEYVKSLETNLGISHAKTSRLCMSLLFSPFRGLQIGVRKHCIIAFFTYPTYRFVTLTSVIKSK